MRKNILAAAFVLALAVGPTAQASETIIDASCLNYNSGLYETTYRNGNELKQSYIPTINRVTQLSTKLKSNPGGTGTVVAQIVDATTGEVVGQDNLTYAAAETYYYFNSFYNDDSDLEYVTVTPGQTYYIIITSNQTVAQNYLHWFYTNDCSYTGSAYKNGAIQTGNDFDFSVWGYQYTAPAEPAAPAETTPTTPTTTSSSTPSTTSSSTPTTSTSSSTSSTSSTSASTTSSNPTSTTSTTTSTKSATTAAKPPATETSEALAAPANVQAEFIPESMAVKLTWAATVSEDVDGYIVFRSIDNEDGYTEIGRSAIGVTEFLDTSSIELDKTYFYQIRSHKGTDESVSSDAVSLTTPVVIDQPAEVTTSTSRRAEVIKLRQLTMLSLSLALLLALFALYEIQQHRLRRRG